MRIYHMQRKNARGRRKVFLKIVGMTRKKREISPLCTKYAGTAGEKAGDTSRGRDIRKSGAGGSSMSKNVIAAALALVLAGTLTACGMTGDSMGNDMTGNNGAARTGHAYGQRPDGRAAGNLWGDGRYDADREGWVNGRGEGTVTGDLTQGARDLMRGAGDAVEDAGDAVGGALGATDRYADQ
jgi:hypothetical protein